MANDSLPADEHDIPWKEAIEGAFPEFMAFYFPAGHAIIDWMLQLPKPLEQQVWQDIETIEGKADMKYVTSVERLAIERGRLAGMAEGKAEGKAETLSRQLTRRFGPLPEWVGPRLQGATADQLDLWADRVLDAPTLLGVFDGH